MLITLTDIESCFYKHVYDQVYRTEEEPGWSRGWGGGGLTADRSLCSFSLPSRLHMRGTPPPTPEGQIHFKHSIFCVALNHNEVPLSYLTSRTCLYIVLSLNKPSVPMLLNLFMLFLPPHGHVFTFPLFASCMVEFRPIACRFKAGTHYGLKQLKGKIVCMLHMII